MHSELFERVLKEVSEKVAYKNSDDARFEVEEGELDEDVIVKDRFTNGKAITFVWSRRKSNENVMDTGQGKTGISFYQARYVYRDPYLDKDSVKTTNPGGLSVVGTVFNNDKEAMLVIKERLEGKDEEGDPKIRIFSATYANNDVQLAYFQRAFMLAKKFGGAEHLEESPDEDIFIESTTMKRRTRLY